MIRFMYYIQLFIFVSTVLSWIFFLLGYGNFGYQILEAKPIQPYSQKAFPSVPTDRLKVNAEKVCRSLNAAFYTHDNFTFPAFNLAAMNMTLEELLEMVFFCDKQPYESGNVGVGGERTIKLDSRFRNASNKQLKLRATNELVDPFYKAIKWLTDWQQKSKEEILNARNAQPRPSARINQLIYRNCVRSERCAASVGIIIGLNCCHLLFFVSIVSVISFWESAFGDEKHPKTFRTIRGGNGILWDSIRVAVAIFLSICAAGVGYVFGFRFKVYSWVMAGGCMTAVTIFWFLDIYIVHYGLMFTDLLDIPDMYATSFRPLNPKQSAGRLDQEPEGRIRPRNHSRKNRKTPSGDSPKHYDNW